MKAKQLRPVFYFAIVLLSLGCFAPSTSAQPFAYGKIEMTYQRVDFRRGDGTVFNAEFLAEFVLFPDGRANGGFGMWDLEGKDILSLYRVTEGRNNGPFWTFKAKRLAGDPLDVITINVRVGASIVPAGSVTFFEVSTSSSQVTFTAQGEVSNCSSRCTEPPPQFGLIRSEPQTVLVESFSGNYTASFENVALVLSEGRAIGSLVLSSPNGLPERIRIKGGEIDFRNGNVSWLRGQTSGSANPTPDTIRIVNADSPTEPCRIYDIAGTQVPAHFEADGRITSLVVDPD
jgi:hypothetical protein